MAKRFGTTGWSYRGSPSMERAHVFQVDPGPYAGASAVVATYVLAGGAHPEIVAPVCLAISLFFAFIKGE